MGEIFKLKTSLSLNDNMMTELVVYCITKGVLPVRRFDFWWSPFSLSSPLTHSRVILFFNWHPSNQDGSKSVFPERKIPIILRVEKPLNVIRSKNPLNKWILSSIALSKVHPAFIQSPPGDKTCQISDSTFASVDSASDCKDFWKSASNLPAPWHLLFRRGMLLLFSH